MTTLACCSARASAMASPIRRPAPVTRAVWPLSDIRLLSAHGLRCRREHRLGMSRDHQVLIGGDDPDGAVALGATDDVAVRSVAALVEHHAQMAEAFADFPPNRRRPLADPAGENQRVEAAEHRR